MIEMIGYTHLPINHSFPDMSLISRQGNIGGITGNNYSTRTVGL